MNICKELHRILAQYIVIIIIFKESLTLSLQVSFREFVNPLKLCEILEDKHFLGESQGIHLLLREFKVSQRLRTSHLNDPQDPSPKRLRFSAVRGCYSFHKD